MNLTEQLEELAEAEAPPMLIDIDRARTTGRRRRIRRRTALVGAITAVALTGALITPQLVHSGNSPGPEPGPAAPPPISAPLVTYATFGWVPESLNERAFNRGPHGDVTKAVNRTVDLGTQLVLTVYPAGDVPRIPNFRKGQQQLNVPAPPVNGRTAYWATLDASDPLNDGDAFLVWQAPDGQWVVMHAYYLNFFDDPQAVLHRVASDVTVATRAQPIPVRITGMPEKFRVDEAMLIRPMLKDDGTGAWQLQLFYAKSSYVFTIVVVPEGSLEQKKKETLTCRAAEGVEVCIPGGEYSDAEAIKELGGPQGVLDHFIPLGMDESKWETN